MKKTDLIFDYPEELVALHPQRPSRVMWVKSNGEPCEIPFNELIEKFERNDVLVINNTKVLSRRVFAEDLEILFLQNLGGKRWQVLFPSKNIRVGQEIVLPENLKMRLVEKGRPQTVELSEEVEESYFQRIAELPLPPYIQKARGERHNRPEDKNWYQTAWAKAPGSFAAPTASLHFSSQDLEALRGRGVRIVEVTLHVGLGTFLPITSESLEDHQMHAEWIVIPRESAQIIHEAKKAHQRVWSLGTTVTRSLESWAHGLLQESSEGDWSGFSQLFIRPGFEYKIVDRLMTNFHQPESTLLALVAAFASLKNVKQNYQWAIERKFRLFSYGDLSVWEKQERT